VAPHEDVWVRERRHGRGVYRYGVGSGSYRRARTPRRSESSNCGDARYARRVVVAIGANRAIVVCAAIIACTGASAVASAQSVREGTGGGASAAPFEVEYVRRAEDDACRVQQVSGARRAGARVVATDPRWSRTAHAIERELTQRIYAELDRAARADGAFAINLAGALTVALAWDTSRWTITSALSTDTRIATIEQHVWGAVLGATSAPRAPTINDGHCDAAVRAGSVHERVSAASDERRDETRRGLAAHVDGQAAAVPRLRRASKITRAGEAP
jgi:hypothetical protein